MKTEGHNDWIERLDGRLLKSGLRLTSQRRQVYSILMDQRDHPTAEQVFMRAKSSMPEISMATVYNTLDTLIKCDLVNEVNLQQTAKRYCPNMSRHGHFFCNSCETVYDIPIVDSEVPAALEMPEGFQLEQTNVSMRGMCPDCNNQK